MFEQKGLLFVLSGPSGVGKGTVRARLFEQETHLKYSVSATTRDKRPGEKEGIDYFYKTETAFKEMIAKGELLEHAQFVGNHYGTPKAYVEQQMEKGNDVFLEIEVQGALQVKRNFPEGVFIFLFPPSLEELKNRIVGRGTESKELVRNRLKEAKNEIDMMGEYDYVVVNDNVDHAVEKIKAIIMSEHCKRERIENQYKKIMEDDTNVRTIN